LSGIKKLAGQTMWYGGSSIIARLLNYLLTPYLTSILLTSAYGEMSMVYALIPFLNILFTYGLETAYFRFIQDKEKAPDVYNTITVSLIVSTISLTVLMLLFRRDLASLISLEEHPEYITWSTVIISFDALSAIAFAKLRQEGRPIKYASIRIAGILINIAVVVFFLSICPALLKKNQNSPLLLFYNEKSEVSYVFIANMVQSVVTFLLLWKEFFAFRWKFNRKLWREIMVYAMPLIIAGFGGMINETFDRIMLGWWSTAPNPLSEVGVYSGCYKLAILITLFIQAFRLGAEPFFFKLAGGENPQKTYARVMKFFVIVVCLMFLVVALYIDVWKYFLRKHEYWTGLKVVPILLLANIFLGIYYNLSIWYKITNKTMAGAWITIIGALLTILINYLFIPRFGYMACAWATFICYGTMMVISYIWGQKAYRIPYAWKKLVAYMVIVVILYLLHLLFAKIQFAAWVNRGLAAVLIGAFLIFVLNVEKKEFQKIPVLRKLIR